MPGFRTRLFLQDRSGAISIVGALSTFMLLAIAAIVIDVGHLYFARRDLQSTTDAAALAAVQNPLNAYAVAMDVFTRNGYGDETLTITTGSYSADEALSVADRFTPTTTDPDAVRVHAVRDQGNYLAGIFGSSLSTLATEATAARVPTISFGAATRLASLNAGLINTLLGKLFGSSVSLSLIDYQALLNTNIDALMFFDTLASNVGVTGSYEQLANSSVTMSQVLDAAAQTADTSNGATGDPVAADFALKSLQTEIPGSTPVKLSDVTDMTPLYGRTIGGIATNDATAFHLNLFSLLSASARTVSQNQLINLGTSLTVPITNSSVTTRLAIGAPFAQISNGKVGSSIQTAQIRLALTATVTNINLGVATATIQLPLYLEGAYGKATVTRLPCVVGGTLAEIEGISGATSLKFGTVTEAALKDFSTPVTPASSPVVSVSLLGIPVQVNASGSATVATHGPQTLTFSQDEIDAGTVKSVPSGATSPFSALSSSVALNSSILGSPGLLAGVLNTQINTLLGTLKPAVSNLIAQLDTPVSNTLLSLGITLGMIDVRVFGASCRTPVLVE